jgi:two-component system, OmpR family, KDP operon response regulator KdpE
VSSHGRLLVIDDDTTLLRLLEFSLGVAGYEVDCAISGRDGLRTFFERRPDLVILDLMMPEMTGWEVCRRLREVSAVPVLMLTALHQAEDRIRGLEDGADDYLVKPFDVQELTLRVAAILRRTGVGGTGAEGIRVNSRYDDGHLFIDLDSHTVSYEGRLIKLTPQEFDLLACFVRQPGKTLSRDYLRNQVWGFTGGHGKDYVKTYIRYIRRKIEPDPDRPAYILTEHGIGYRLAWPGRGRVS